MAGTKEGGLKAAAKNKELDPDFYKKIGRLGGKISRGGGFAMSHETAVEAGRKGGMASRRTQKVYDYSFCNDCQEITATVKRGTTLSCRDCYRHKEIEHESDD